VTVITKHGGLLGKRQPEKSCLPANPAYFPRRFYLNNLSSSLSFFGRNPEVLGVDKDFADNRVPISLKFFSNDSPYPTRNPQKFPPQKAPQPPSSPSSLRHPTRKKAGGEAAA
jgi:hypothetical protein